MVQPSPEIADYYVEKKATAEMSQTDGLPTTIAEASPVNDYQAQKRKLKKEVRKLMRQLKVWLKLKS